jgi:aspartyl-tRNA(Asn)/glutamyl-tRNA(Gln) amidotransferase subunit A
MTYADENHWSRRTFMKSALGSAAASLITVADNQQGRAENGPADPPHGSNLTNLSLSEASALVRARKVSPVELTQACLDRIEKLNPVLNAFITITAETALTQAREAEAEIKRGGWKGPLHGVPVAVKDLLDTAGVRTTGASELFKDRVPTRDAEVVRRLKAAGAVLLGKLNMHELAYGGSSVISYYGPVHNPWEPHFSTGGSSGGSAAAVAAGLCYGAIGSDTGGSIREPAAYCGIVGLKPTYGRVSTRGAIPLSWSLDHLGPMTRTTMDAALMLQVIAGYDPEDTNSTDTPVPDYAVAMAGKTSRLRIGITHAHFHEGLDPEIQAAMDAALEVVRTITASRSDVEVPAAMDTATLILRAEAFTYHRESVLKTPALYQSETLRRLKAGADITATEYIGAVRQMEQLRRFVLKVFESVDLVITPTTPVPPFAIAELLAGVEDMRAKEVLMLRNTRSFNLLGLPTISVPCGFTSKGLPIGMQITGPPGGEASVLRLAHAYEQATEWHRRGPRLG